MRDGRAGASRRASRTCRRCSGLIGLADGERPRREAGAEALDEPRPHRGVLLLADLYASLFTGRSQRQIVELRAVPPERVEGGGGVDDVRCILGRATGDLVGEPRRREVLEEQDERASRCRRCRCSTRQACAAQASTRSPGRTRSRSGRSRSAQPPSRSRGSTTRSWRRLSRARAAARRPRRSGASGQQTEDADPLTRPVRSRRRSTRSPSASLSQSGVKSIE